MQRTTSFLRFLAVVALAAAPVQAQWSSQALWAARQGPAAVVVGNKALFAGGSTGPATMSAVVDIYDGTTGIWSKTDLSVGRRDLAATAVGSLALFAGGATSQTTNTAVVDVFDAQKMT